MINPKIFMELLKEKGIGFFTGVPDSLLKSFCACLTETLSAQDHIINVNEGAAISLGAGFHLATGKIPLIYMQNSGLGNSVNPLLSLADKEVYSIPMLLLIGWRGNPDVVDEPQHIKQGRVTLQMLDAMEIPYWVIDSETDNIQQLLNEVVIRIKDKSAPAAIVVKKNTFEGYTLNTDVSDFLTMTRERAIQVVADAISKEDLIVSTTGKISRELFEFRKTMQQKHHQDFLTVGSMGFASQIALGIALQQKKQVFCFDGDGAALMHMGNLALIGNKNCKNFNHILFNNGVHDSVGGQPTIGFDIDFMKLAMSVGYHNAYIAKAEEEIVECFERINKSDGPSFLEIQVKKGARKELIRPDISPIDNKKLFTDFLANNEAV